MNNNSDQFCAHWEGKVVSPVSTKEFLATLEEEARAADEAEFAGMSQYERARVEQKKAETMCREACIQLRALLNERRSCIFAALYKPILVPASLIGALIAGAVVQGDIGLVIAGTGIAIDVGGTAWLLNRTREKLSFIRRGIERCRGTIGGYREKYGREVEWFLAEVSLPSGENRF